MNRERKTTDIGCFSEEITGDFSSHMQLILQRISSQRHAYDRRFVLGILPPNIMATIGTNNGRVRSSKQAEPLTMDL
jgi:hypothetical protein